MKYQVFNCDVCWRDWSRPSTRGRPPLTCPRCRKPKTTSKPVTSNVPVIVTDGGRKDEGLPWEPSDCTVRCIATATGVPYSKAYAFMAANGRKKGKGAYFWSAISRNDGIVFGHHFENAQGIARARGLRKFLELNPRCKSGTWALQMTHHVATLRDGKLLDSFDSSRKEIRGAWKVEPCI